jgi:hypothetical protein
MLCIRQQNYGFFYNAFTECQRPSKKGNAHVDGIVSKSWAFGIALEHG